MQNGYVIFYNGLIMQWTTFSGNDFSGPSSVDGLPYWLDKSLPIVFKEQNTFFASYSLTRYRGNNINNWAQAATETNIYKTDWHIILSSNQYNNIFTNDYAKLAEFKAFAIGI